MRDILANRDGEGSNDELDDDDMEELIRALNARSLQAVLHLDGQRQNPIPGTTQPTCGVCSNTAKTDNTCDCAAYHDTQWWSRKAVRYNDAWVVDEGKPDVMPRASHPASRDSPHTAGTADERRNSANAEELRGNNFKVDDIKRDIEATRNKVNRHQEHTPYCLRPNTKTGMLSCFCDHPITFL